MTSPNQHQNELPDRDDRLMESLLLRTLAADSEADAGRLTRLMSRIRSEESGTGSAEADSPRSTKQRLLRWLPLPLAAAVVVAVTVLSTGGSTAEAAIAVLDRSLEAAQEETVRQYTVTLTISGPNGSVRRRTHTLYVRQNEFVVEATPAIGPGKVWAGGSGEKRWVVPRLGPVYVGTENAVRRNLPDRRVLETPFMSVERILERTRRFYELSVETTSTGTSTSVSRITGQRKRSPRRVVIPATVEIDADPESGIVQFIRLAWDKEDNALWSEATAELVGTPTVTSDFFRHTGHHDGARRIIEQN